jgi:hypothetical protein
MVVSLLLLVPIRDPAKSILNPGCWFNPEYKRYTKLMNRQVEGPE